MSECPFDYRLNRTPYLVLPKMAIQAMPLDWRRRLDALLDEADATGLETPGYVVLRDEPEYSRSVPEDEYGPLDRVDVFRPDPWADYRHASIETVRNLSPNFDPDKNKSGSETSTKTP